MRDAKDRLLRMLRDKAYLEGDFTLSSGRRANYYIDAKQVTYDPEGAELVGQYVYEALLPFKVQGIGGLTMGADPMATATAIISNRQEHPIPAFIVRKEPKKHGLHKLIEGILKPSMRVAIVDDVVTSGGSVIQAIECVKEIGCEVAVVIALVDRDQGGRQKIEAQGCHFQALCTIHELLQMARGTERQPIYAAGGRR